jgi:hypothetical protein
MFPIPLGINNEWYTCMYITDVPLTLYHRKDKTDISDILFLFYQNDLAMRNTADVTGDKPIAI